MDINEFEVNTDLYENGKKVQFSDNAYIRVRAAGSDKSEKARERLYKPYRGWKKIPAKISAKCSAMWLAQGILTEFVGFTKDGAAIEVDLTKEEDQKRLAEILADPKYMPLRNRIFGFAQEDTNFQTATDEETEKN